MIKISFLHSFLTLSTLHQRSLEAFITDRHNLYRSSTALIAKVLLVLAQKSVKHITYPTTNATVSPHPNPALS